MFLSAVLVAALGAGVTPPASPAPPVQPPSLVTEDPGPPWTTLEEVRAHPSRWLGREFRAVIQFDGPRHDPTILSGFSPSTYWCFSAWGDEQRLWQRSAYRDPAVRLFARRGTAPEVLMRAARRYERFEVEAVVGEVLFGQSWIEVRRVRHIAGAWNEGALVHATRADELMVTGRWLLAADQYERALASRLPEEARLGMEALRDRCHAQHARREEIRRRGKASFGIPH